MREQMQAKDEQMADAMKAKDDAMKAKDAQVAEAMRAKDEQMREQIARTDIVHLAEPLTRRLVVPTAERGHRFGVDAVVVAIARHEGLAHQE